MKWPHCQHPKTNPRAQKTKLDYSTFYLKLSKELWVLKRLSSGQWAIAGISKAKIAFVSF